MEEHKSRILTGGQLRQKVATQSLKQLQEDTQVLGCLWQRVLGENACQTLLSTQPGEVVPER